MAKMFYTIEEVAEKLGKSTEDIREMASSGQIQEFRDRDKLMFKVDQIDLLAGGDEDTGDVHISLEDTSAQSGLDLKEESTIGLADSREGTGISVFDTDHGDLESDTSEDTAVGDFVAGEELSLESVGSGSGLLDLTRESDDTTLGAELLEEVYADDGNIDIPSNSGLFEAAVDSPVDDFAVAAPAAVGVPMVMEAYDGGGSGLGAGLMIGTLASLVCLALIVIVSLSGATSGLAIMIADQLWIWVGGLLIVTLLFGGIGWFIGKASG